MNPDAPGPGQAFWRKIPGPFLPASLTALLLLGLMAYGFAQVRLINFDLRPAMAQSSLVRIQVAELRREIDTLHCHRAAVPTQFPADRESAATRLLELKASADRLLRLAAGRIPIQLPDDAGQLPRLLEQWQARLDRPDAADDPGPKLTSIAASIYWAVRAELQRREDGLLRVQHWLLTMAVVITAAMILLLWYSGQARMTAQRIAQDEHRRALENSLWLDTVLHCMGDGVLITGPDARLLYVNPMAERLTGWTSEQALGRAVQEVFDIRSQEFPAHAVEFVERIIRERLVIGLANHTVLLTRGGDSMPIADSGAPILDPTGKLLGVVVVFQDMTERHEHEQQLRRNLEEKELLLREVHHRVKNNMQVVVSLLDLHSGAMQTPRDASLLSDVRGHIFCMAKVHEMLYEATDLSRITFDDYLRTLCGQLLKSLAVDPRRIALNLELERVELGIDQAVPLGLIVNELLTNALKHAFPEELSGALWLRLAIADQPQVPGEVQILLEVCDNGVGMASELLADNSRLGLRLVRALTSQLQGQLTFTNTCGATGDSGSCFTLNFPRTAKQRLT